MEVNENKKLVYGSVSHIFRQDNVDEIPIRVELYHGTPMYYQL